MTTIKILITGGTGFIAMHIIHMLLADGGYSITATTREISRAHKLYDMFPLYRDKVQLIEVPDITNPTAFDKIFREAETPFDYVLHTASPRMGPCDDFERYVTTGLRGVQALFSSVHKYGGASIKRIVMTSSIAALGSLPPLSGRPRTDATTWFSMTQEDVVLSRSDNLAYCLMKTLGEKEAFKFVRQNHTSFDLVSILPVDIDRGARDHIYALMDGTFSTVKEAVFRKGNNFVDVRDVARAHIDALTKPASSSSRNRLVLSSPELMTPQSVVNILNNQFPELKDRFAKSSDTSQVVPEGTIPEFVGATDVKDIFGWEYRSLQESVVDFTRDIIHAEKEWR